MGLQTGEYGTDKIRGLCKAIDTSPSAGQEFTGGLNVEFYLGGQGFRSGKLSFSAQALDEIHTNGLVINILVKIEDVDLHAEFTVGLYPILAAPS